MSKIDVLNATGRVLDFLVAKAFDPRGGGGLGWWGIDEQGFLYNPLIEARYSPSTDPSLGGRLIEDNNITVIRADNIYIDGVYTKNWFAKCDKWVGHGITTSVEGENIPPSFVVEEDGAYGQTFLVAAMRAFVKMRLGRYVEVPAEIINI